MKKRRLPALIIVITLLSLTACSPESREAVESTVADAQTPATIANESESQEAATTASILSTGPNGEAATPATELSLTEEEKEEIRDGGYTAAICFHYGGNDWSSSQLEGLKATFEDLGIEIVATTDANFSAEQQVADIETVMALDPDIIVAIPVDATSTADAFMRAKEAGIKLVFMDNVPEGFTAGKDYVSCVSADNYGNGVIAADLIGEALNGEGQIGVIYYDADFFVTNQRLEAFEATMAKKYPNIEIVSKLGFQDENACDVVADAMITQNPDIDAIFAHWDIPCEGTLSALRAAGRDDVLLSTIDLGNNVAKEIAEGTILGLGAQLPYDQGAAEATLAGYALRGKDAPDYVAVPAKRVDQSNILAAYEDVYHVSAPEWLAKAAEN